MEEATRPVHQALNSRTLFVPYLVFDLIMKVFL